MESFYRVIKPLASIACLMILIESLRTGMTLGFGRLGLDWVSQEDRPIEFWVANITLFTFAVLGLVGPVYKRCR
jgi:hypothetical protein